jgi:Ca2+/Na+ antiporter
MSKLLILLDCFIILFGVVMAWACAWKAHHYYREEQITRSAAYVVAVIFLLIIVFVQGSISLF